jgi:hypothetical protein
MNSGRGRMVLELDSFTSKGYGNLTYMECYQRMVCRVGVIKCPQMNIFRPEIYRLSPTGKMTADFHCDLLEMENIIIPDDRVPVFGLSGQTPALSQCDVQVNINVQTADCKVNSDYYNAFLMHGGTPPDGSQVHINFGNLVYRGGTHRDESNAILGVTDMTVNNMKIFITIDNFLSDMPFMRYLVMTGTNNRIYVRLKNAQKLPNPANEAVIASGKILFPIQCYSTMPALKVEADVTSEEPLIMLENGYSQIIIFSGIYKVTGAGKEVVKMNMTANNKLVLQNAILRNAGDAPCITAATPATVYCKDVHANSAADATNVTMQGESITVNTDLENYF